LAPPLDRLFLDHFLDEGLRIKNLVAAADGRANDWMYLELIGQHSEAVVKEDPGVGVL
jgi:hypothetical protein